MRRTTGYRIPHVTALILISSAMTTPVGRALTTLAALSAKHYLLGAQRVGDQQHPWATRRSERRLGPRANTGRDRF